jgi:peptidoglycan/LPS O-acetylase OafA/YrhL
VGNILILIFLLPNVTHFYIPYSDQRWSIVVEEQFYLMQPFLIRVFKKRKLLFIAFLVIVFSPELSSGLVRIFHIDRIIPINIIEALILQLKYLACIAVGCIFSVFYFKTENASKKILFSRAVQWSVTGALVVAMAAGFYIFQVDEVIDFRIYALLFSIIVLNASQNPATIFKLEARIPEFLGKISYGIYMYHPACIGLVIALTRAFRVDNLIIQNVLIYCLSIILTILVSWLSFKYFEAFFLRLKARFEIKK